jgi:hypothetical protein
MEQVGVSTNGKIVVKDIGPLYFRDGTPLSIIFDRLIENNILPSWNHLYEEMKDNGMKHSRIIHLLNEQVFESFGKEFRDEVIKRLSVFEKDVLL